MKGHVIEGLTPAGKIERGVISQTIHHRQSYVVIKNPRGFFILSRDTATDLTYEGRKRLGTLTDFHYAVVNG
jgi:hypothetical protein